MLLPLRHDDAAALLKADRPDACALLPVLAKVKRIFVLHNPWAPGLALVGGLLDFTDDCLAEYGRAGFSVTGNGLTPANALVSCLGEAAEAYSQFQHVDDHIFSMHEWPAMTGWLQDLQPAESNQIWCMKGKDLNNNTDIILPADIIVRRPLHVRKIKLNAVLSSGTAAGQSYEDAIKHAVLETIERDAAALWWHGAKHARTLKENCAAAQSALAVLNRLRQGNTERETRILDITTDLDVPVIAACSFDRSGFGLSVGIAAGLNYADAARAALLEMGQMELSIRIAHMKASESGENSLNDADRKHLARNTIQAKDCGLLKPIDSLQSDNTHISDILEHLDRKAITCAVFNLTRADIQVPAARVISPELQPFSDEIMTPRLKEAVHKYGGGHRHHGGISPF
ncbi:MAG: YcaO-like family protein [Beijerinckiaceae bacterium]